MRTPMNTPANTPMNTPVSTLPAERFLNPHQARQRAPTPYEDLLGDAIECAFAAGVHDLDGLLHHVNQSGPRGPDGAPWSAATFQSEMARLDA